MRPVLVRAGSLSVPVYVVVAAPAASAATAATAATIAVASRVEKELPVDSAPRALYSRGGWLFSLGRLVVPAACHSSPSFGSSAARILDGGVKLFSTLVMSTAD